MGNEEFLYFTMKGESFISRIPSDKAHGLKMGDSEDFYFKMENSHLFDPETDENITL